MLRNTIAMQWPALARWTPEYLAEHVGTLQDVYQHHLKVFTFYDPHKPMVEIPGIAEDVRTSHKMVRGCYTAADANPMRRAPRLTRGRALALA